jgi:hypothetical protein
MKIIKRILFAILGLPIVACLFLVFGVISGSPAVAVTMIFSKYYQATFWQKMLLSVCLLFFYVWGLKSGMQWLEKRLNHVKSEAAKKMYFLYDTLLLLFVGGIIYGILLLLEAFQRNSLFFAATGILAIIGFSWPIPKILRTQKEHKAES